MRNVESKFKVRLWTGNDGCNNLVFFHSDVQSTEPPSTIIEAGNMTLIFVATSIGVVIVALVVVIAALVYRQRRHGTHQINAGKQRKGRKS